MTLVEALLPFDVNETISSSVASSNPKRSASRAASVA